MRSKRCPPEFAAEWKRFWHAHDEYAAEVARYETATGMAADASVFPFLFGGRLDRPRLVVFGLGPSLGRGRRHPVGRSRRRAHYLSRLEQFDVDAMPHRLHDVLGRICLGWTTGDAPGGDACLLARPLHRAGYVAFDLFPYYARWKPFKWNGDAADLARRHFARCLAMLERNVAGRRPPECVLFSGKPWVQALIARRGRDPAPILEGFSPDGAPTKLRDILCGTKVSNVGVHVGRIRCGRRDVRAVILGGLAHRIHGMGYDQARDLGLWLHRSVPGPPSVARAVSRAAPPAPRACAASRP